MERKEIENKFESCINSGLPEKSIAYALMAIADVLNRTLDLTKETTERALKTQETAMETLEAMKKDAGA